MIRSTLGIGAHFFRVSLRAISRHQITVGSLNGILIAHRLLHAGTAPQIELGRAERSGTTGARGGIKNDHARTAVCGLNRRTGAGAAKAHNQDIGSTLPRRDLFCL